MDERVRQTVDQIKNTNWGEKYSTLKIFNVFKYEFGIFAEM